MYLPSGSTVVGPPLDEIRYIVLASSLDAIISAYFPSSRPSCIYEEKKQVGKLAKVNLTRD